jgi:DNA-damage-inducible protein J
MMSATTKITVRMDETVKSQLENVLENLGMNLSTGINVLAKAVIRHGGIPFDLYDPFYSDANLSRITASKKSVSDGNVIYKTSQELGLDDIE